MSAVLMAFAPRMTLWGLTELKMEILIQVSPVFILGAVWNRLEARAALAGMIGGALVGGALAVAGVGAVAGVQSGLIGWFLNVALCVSLSLAQTKAGERKGLRSPAEDVTG